MAKGWGPAYRLSPISEIEKARAPTQDELENLYHQLNEWRGAHPECMPSDLWVKLRQFIEWQTLQYPWTRRQIQLTRWSFVREGRDRLGKSWDEAYEYARDQCQGTPAQAGADMMKKSYDEVQRELPPEQRRPRTYKRRKR
jgi:hypothetical protein